MESHPQVLAANSDVSLPIAKAYRCPGETSPVSVAVHLGRLASGWSGCTDCAWRHEIGDTANSLQRSDAEELRKNRAGIRRTEFGVRGAYLNAIDRFRGAQLASIFSIHLASVHNDLARQLRRTPTGADGDANFMDAGSTITVAIGYDGRHGAADVFSGVVSSVLQNGCNVVDAGRSSASSLLHVSRRYPHVCGSLLVTGAGGGPGDIGMDVFDRHGQGVAVPWQKFGVAVRLESCGAPASAAEQNLPFAALSRLSVANAVQADFRQLRSTISAETTADPETPVHQESAILHLPELHNSAGLVFRARRSSGTLSAIPSEQYYRDWLLRWWPVQSRQPVRFFVNDDHSAERLKWLTHHCSLNVEFHRSASHSADRPSCDGVPGFELHEDDRFLTVRSRRGREIPVAETADWINRFMPPSSTHLTAHASPCGRRLLLVDVAAPDSGNQQQVISDGLALAGWILTCRDDGNNPLPV